MEKGNLQGALTLIEETFPKTIMNSQKAELLLLKIEIYAKIIIDKITIVSGKSGLSTIGINSPPGDSYQCNTDFDYDCDGILNGDEEENHERIYDCNTNFDSDCDGILNGDEESHPQGSSTPECYQDDSECGVVNCEYTRISDEGCSKICYTPKCNNNFCEVEKKEDYSNTISCDDMKFSDCSSKCNSEKNSCENSCEKDFQQEDPLNGCLVDCSTSLQECINTCS